MKKIIVRYSVPCDPIQFFKWLPDGEEDILKREKEDFTARLWIDYSCVNRHGEELNEEVISKWANVTVNKVFIDVEVDNLPDELVDFIYDERESPRQTHHGLSPGEGNYEELSASYKDLGIKVQYFAITFCNRLISFVRNHKLQYWLEEIVFDEGNISSRDVEFLAKVKINDYDWVRWCPYNEMHFNVMIPSDDIIIKPEEWGDIKEFVAGDSRSRLFSELLANAKSFIDSRHRGNAIIQAVTALQIAVSNFSRKPILDGLLSDEAKERINVQHLNEQYKHLGFSGTVNYLLPILFPPDVLKTDILRKCQDAITLRNNIVHNGQRDRDVDEVLTRQCVTAIIDACRVLFKYTDRN